MLIIHRPAQPEDAAAAILAAMRDERLTVRARGLLGMFLAHAGEDWPGVSIDKLAVAIAHRGRALTGIGEGRQAIRTALVELEHAGYLVRRKAGNGVRAGHFIEIFHAPDDARVIPPQPDKDGNCEVYLIGQHGSNLVKIGTTEDLQKRLKGVQASYPLRLEVLWHRPGGWGMAEYLRERFAGLKADGGWYDFGDLDPQEAVLEAVAEKYPAPEWL
jgi:hypothetical protein